MRKITGKERKNGMKYCTFCKPSKVDAIYRDYLLQFACETHKKQLASDVNSMSEADYQTWGRIV